MHHLTPEIIPGISKVRWEFFWYLIFWIFLVVGLYDCLGFSFSILLCRLCVRKLWNGYYHLESTISPPNTDNQIYLKLGPRQVCRMTRLFDVYQWQTFLMNFYTTFSVQCWKPATDESILLAEQDFTHITRRISNIFSTSLPNIFRIIIYKYE